jgi:hypothetical protein
VFAKYESSLGSEDSMAYTLIVKARNKNLNIVQLEAIMRCEEAVEPSLPSLLGKFTVHKTSVPWTINTCSKKGVTEKKAVFYIFSNGKNLILEP